MQLAKNRMLVIGLGNQHRGDDGVGLWVARQLRSRRLAGVAVREVAGDAVRLLDEWREGDVVYVVDAMTSGATPGTFLRMDVTNDSLSKNLFRLSTHGTGIAEAVELARALQRLPRRLVIYGIEGSSFGTGAPISPEVERGAEQAIDAILKEIYGREGAPQICMSGD